MRKEYIILSALITLFAITEVKSQDLANYNLYISNPVLYNPAYSVDSTKIRAFVNSHLQWAGFDGAPQVNTFGVYGNFVKNMGIGLSVFNLKQGLTSNTYINLNYGYRAFFSDKHYLSLGIAFGVLLDNLATNKIANADMTDPLIATNDYKQTSISSRVGISYVYKNFEAQLVMPQLLEHKKVNTYMLGMLSYNFKLNSLWDLKPLVMFRDVSTSPAQYEFNMIGTYNKSIWAQIGYRSNKSYITGIGGNFKGFSLGYAYQMENNYMPTAVQSTHEVQLIYRFGKTTSTKKASKADINGFVKDSYSQKFVKANIQITENETVKSSTVSDGENGNFSTKLALDKTYTIKATAPGYSDYSETLTLSKSDLGKTIEIQMIPENTEINGTIVSKGDNKPLSGNIRITESGSEVYNQVADGGVFKLNLKSGKTYQIELSSDNFQTVSQTIDIPEKTLNKKIQFVVDFISEVSGNVTDNVTGKPVESSITFYKDGNLLQTIEANGNYTVKLQQGLIYEYECKADGYFTKKGKADLSSSSSSIQNIQLDKVKNEGYTIGKFSFETGQDVLKAESLPILDQFYQKLMDNPNLKFEISGYTDNVGNAEWNKKLSQKRAQVCVDYLVKKGISANRLIAKGYGSENPIVPNTTLENKEINRRVEVKVIE
jgi:type IX secretion system PorP/SprF family membrane protein